MQFDLFNAAEKAPALTLLEHASSDYAPRTGENARGADVTVAFALDFETHGERLTARMAGRKYIGIPYGIDASEAAQQLTEFLLKLSGRTLNIAGNGIYTLAPSGLASLAELAQRNANQWVYDVLALVTARTPLAHIRSGGQTGIDTAGLVAGLALGIPVTGLYPKGFRQRLANRQDVTSTKEPLAQELRRYVAALTLRKSL